MQNIIIMTNKESQRYEIINNLINNKLNGTQASKQLNLSVRQTKRLKAKVIKEGIKGIIHKNRGKESNRKLDEELKNKVIKIIKEKYPDFSSQLTYEKINEVHNIKISYSSIRRVRINEKLNKVKKRKENTKHFSQRERKEYYGELVQFDGSYHNWFEGRNEEKEQCLLLSVDDATGDMIPKFDKNEGIEAVFNYWKEYIQNKGKPIAIYIDKFSTYKVNHKNAVDNQEFITQFQRAMKELDIQVIFANTPQAKGRVERMNETLQDRLIKEMRLAGISNVQQANEFIKNFTLEFNKKFNVSAKKKGDLHRKITKKENLNSIFSIKNKRKVRNDFVVQYKNRFFQLNELQPITIYRKDEVIIEEHLDNSIHICKKEKYLNFKELPYKPKKEIKLMLPAITTHKSNYIPPTDHPWRNYQFKKERVTN
jgi:hypothetical protein